MKSHCPQGYPYDAANTYTCRGQQYCRACRRVRAAQEARERRSDAGLAELRAALRIAGRAGRAA